MKKKMQIHYGIDSWGSNLWKAMHVMTFLYSDNPTSKEKKAAQSFFEALPYMLPCSICKQDFKQYVKYIPLKNKRVLSTWLWNVHNNINKKLGKKMISYEECQRMFSPFPIMKPANSENVNVMPAKTTRWIWVILTMLVFLIAIAVCLAVFNFQK